MKSVIFVALSCLALENAKVLPSGVRRLNIKAVQVDLATKFDDDGKLVSLAKPLAKDISFREVLKGKEGLDNSKLRAFLQENSISESQVLGSLSADLKGRMQVVAPVIAYGVNDWLTVALAVPYYFARTDVDLGYRANDSNVQNFIDLLSSPRYNQVASAQEVYDNFADGVAALNGKLADNGYRELGAWEEHGLGDMTLALKSQLVGDESGIVRLANLSGIVAPTGRTDDPDLLSDVPFGDGSWDLFTGLMCDQELGAGFFLNQFVKFTYQTEAEREVRLKTADEALVVEKQSITYQLGNKFDVGASVQWANDLGIELGLGYEFNGKSADDYQAPTVAAEKELEKETMTRANNIELKVGYSSVPAFRRKEIPVPFNVSVQYKQVVDNELLARNRNVAATKLFSLDLNLYF